ncbi:outer membrane protein [Paracoccus sp. p4-l81]|uniref:outer membrane protein n=1 Tax=unclassified Paracoccus (in: a-proteobacteria) TaxID=2688777 RepID=UPI0035B8C350
MKSLFLIPMALMASAGFASAGSLAAPAADPVLAMPVVTEYQVDPSDWTGFYMGAQAGKANGKLKTSGTQPKFDGTTYGLHAGYMQDMGQFVLGGELSYDKLAKAKLGGISADGSMLRAKALAGYDAGDFLPYATVGAERLTLENAAANGGDLKETGLVYGVGVKYRAAENIMVGAEVLRHNFKDIDNTKGRSLDATTIGANVSFRF